MPGWDNFRRLPVEMSELDAVTNTVLCMSQLNLSARAYHRILELSRTIADLAGVKKSSLCIRQKRCNIVRRS